MTATSVEVGSSTCVRWCVTTRRGSGDPAWSAPIISRAYFDSEAGADDYVTERARDGVILGRSYSKAREEFPLSPELLSDDLGTLQK